MADFYPVLKRAISALPSGNQATRGVIYSRARTALNHQLANYNPPLPSEEIETQREALERAIALIEAEQAAAPPPQSPTTAAPYPGRPGGAATQGLSASVPRPPADRPAAPPLQTRAERLQPGLPPKPDAIHGGALAAPARPASLPAHPTPAPGPTPAPTHGPIPAHPRPANAWTPPGPQTNGGATTGGAIGETAQKPSQLSSMAHWRAQPPQLPPLASTLSTAGGQPPNRPMTPPPPPLASTPFTADDPPPDQPMPVASRPLDAADDGETGGPAGRRILLRADPGLLQRLTRGAKNPLYFTAFVAVVLAITLGTVGWLQREQLAQWFHPSVAAGVAVQSSDATNDGLGPKSLDRLPPDETMGTAAQNDIRAVPTEKVSGDATPADNGATVTYSAGTPGATTSFARNEASSAPAPTPTPAPVASIQSDSVQKVYLYVEGLGGSHTQRFEGTAKWSLVNEPPVPHDPSVPQVRLDISVPDQDLTLKMYIRASGEGDSPISHYVDLAFTTGPKFSGRGVQNVFRLSMKATEADRGDPLIGGVKQVIDNRFWLGLSADKESRTRNIDLLKNRDWIDISLELADRRDAIIAVEKGDAGTAAINNGFAAFGE